jgi:hypothetical protein
MLSYWLKYRLRTLYSNGNERRLGNFANKINFKWYQFNDNIVNQIDRN